MKEIPESLKYPLFVTLVRAPAKVVQEHLDARQADRYGDPEVKFPGIVEQGRGLYTAVASIEQYADEHFVIAEYFNDKLGVRALSVSLVGHSAEIVWVLDNGRLDSIRVEDPEEFCRQHGYEVPKPPRPPPGPPTPPPRDAILIEGLDVDAARDLIPDAPVEVTIHESAHGAVLLSSGRRITRHVRLHELSTAAAPRTIYHLRWYPAGGERPQESLRCNLYSGGDLRSELLLPQVRGFAPTPQIDNVFGETTIDGVMKAFGLTRETLSHD